MKFIFTKSEHEGATYFLRLGDHRHVALDSRDGRYHEGNDVLGWEWHKGDNQVFTINDDSTISPKNNP